MELEKAVARVPPTVPAPAVASRASDNIVLSTQRTGAKDAVRGDRIRRDELRPHAVVPLRMRSLPRPQACHDFLHERFVVPINP